MRRSARGRSIDLVWAVWLERAGRPAGNRGRPVRLLIVTVEGLYPACAVHQDAEQSQHDSSNVIAAAVVCQHGSGPGLGDCASMARPPGIAIGVGDATDKGLGAVQVTGPRD